jgi:trehalose 6-phosphate phosphatase
VTESSRQTDASLSRALSIARRALAEIPAGLLTDFDGTLSPIVADPGLARLVDGASEALTALVDRLAVVAVITGRAPLDARRMTGVEGLLVAGNHGTEWLEPRATQPAPSPEAAAVRLRLDDTLDRLPLLPGVTIEHKGLSATVHYRGAADPEEARRRLRRAIGTAVPGMEVRGGRMSLELRPVGLGDKGSATRAVVDRFGLRGVVVMGDDLTDLDMFRAVGELRAARRLSAAIIGVGGGDGEVPPEVAAAADVLLAGPAEAAALLVGLAES